MGDLANRLAGKGSPPSRCDVKPCRILARQRKRGVCRLGMCSALDELNAAPAVCDVKVVEILVLGHLWTAFPVGTLILFLIGMNDHFLYVREPCVPSSDGAASDQEHYAQVFYYYPCVMDGSLYFWLLDWIRIIIIIMIVQLQECLRTWMCVYECVSDLP